MNENSCVDSVYDYPDMVENYMDYSDDGCMNMLTYGQKQRVWSFLNTARAGLFNSSGCNTTVAVDELQSGQWTVYPNPSSGVVRIEGSERIQSLKVTDLTGRTVWESQGAGVSEVNLTGNSPGIYFFHILGEDKIAVQRVVIR